MKHQYQLNVKGFDRNLYPSLTLRKTPQAKFVYFGLFSSYHFHVIVDDGIIYLCMADEEFGKRQPYAFLEEVCQILDLQKGISIKQILFDTLHVELTM